MARYYVVITALTIVALVTGCDRSSSKSPVGPGDKFGGLRIIDDMEYFSESMREALLNHYASYGYYGNGVDYNDQAPECPASASVPYALGAQHNPLRLPTVRSGSFSPSASAAVAMPNSANQISQPDTREPGSYLPDEPDMPCCTKIKYVHFKDGAPPFFYDLVKDSSESNNLANDMSHAKKLLDLTSKMLDHRMRHPRSAPDRSGVDRGAQLPISGA